MVAPDPVGEMRLKYGFQVVVIGLLVALVVVVIALLKLADGTSIAGVVASFTGLVGTTVGAFFGVQIGAAVKEKAEAERNTVQKKMARMAVADTPEQRASILAE